MRKLFGLFLLICFIACGDNSMTTNATNVDTTYNLTDTKAKIIPSVVSNAYWYDTNYEISKSHKPFFIAGYFDQDQILDTAILVRQKSSGKNALFIKHSENSKIFLLKNGNDIGTKFNDFNWVGQFKTITKGTKVWNNVIDDEIVGEDKIPESKKLTLKTDGIFVHIDEASGGGIIYFKNGKYAWVQQD